MATKILIVVGGATASGKTRTAIALAQFFDAPILSCDSRQFYREMEIGTAKPNTEERAAAKHFFIDNLSIHDSYSVGQYEREAIETLQNIYKNQDVSILVGGTGLYIRAVCEGLDDFPMVSDVIKQDLQAIFEQSGLECLQKELASKDPVYYEEVDVHNPHRVLRALGVIRATNKPFSSFRSKSKKTRFFTPIYLCMDWERADLYQRINQRVDMMVETGLLEEVKKLYVHKHVNALQTVGYQEFFDYLDGQCSFEMAVELVKRNTRRYAKRQVTWFRKDKHWQYFHPKNIDLMKAFVSAHILRNAD